MSLNACSHKISGLYSSARKVDDLRGDGSFDAIVAVPQSDADQSRPPDSSFDSLRCGWKEGPAVRAGQNLLFARFR